MNKTFARNTIKESLIVIVITIIYIIVWIASLFINQKYKGLFLPLWFEISCIYLPIIFIITIYFISKKIFSYVNFEKINKSQKENNKNE